MRLIVRLRWLPVVAALGLLVGCRDVQKAVSTDFDIPTPGEPGLYPSLGITVSDGPELVANLSLIQVGHELDVASYMGELQYDMKALKLVGGSFPARVQGELFEISPGRLRFVGTADAGLAGAPLLTLRFGAGGEIKRGSVTVQIEELTAAGDLADLTQSVKNGVLLLRKVE